MTPRAGSSGVRGSWGAGALFPLAATAVPADAMASFSRARAARCWVAAKVASSGRGPESRRAAWSVNSTAPATASVASRLLSPGIRASARRSAAARVPCQLDRSRHAGRPAFAGRLRARGFAHAGIARHSIAGPARRRPHCAGDGIASLRRIVFPCGQLERPGRLGGAANGFGLRQWGVGSLKGG